GSASDLPRSHARRGNASIRRSASIRPAARRPNRTSCRRCSRGRARRPRSGLRRHSHAERGNERNGLEGSQMGQPSREPGTHGAIGIVAATGGIQAIPEILTGLPREFALPILVVQAMRDAYLTAFVARLAEKCRLSVTVAEDGQVPGPGKVFVSGADRNL